MPYEPKQYWESLLVAEPSLRGVGYPELPERFNCALYEAMRQSAVRALAGAGFTLPDSATVLDVGCGTGFWISFWRRFGADRITGVDLTATAVERLSRDFPELAFVQADVAAGLPGEQTFDVVSVMSVLLHIPDEERFASAIGNIASVVRSGGVVLVIDPLIVYRWWGPPLGTDANSRLRRIDDWRRIAANYDLELASLVPVTVLLANPIDTRRRVSFVALSIYWRLLSRVLCRRDWLARLVVPGLAAADRALVRALRTGPSTKCFVFRKT